MNEYRKQLGYVGIYVFGFITVTFFIVFLLTGCGPTLLSVGVLDVTAGDVVANGAKYKLLLNDDDKQK
jgi:hypothetical protein